MIVGSLLLIVAAVGLLAAGVLEGANGLLVASIVASLLAAIALIVGGRRAAAERAAATATRSTGARSRARAAGAEREAVGVDLAESRRNRRAMDREPVGAGVGYGGSTYGTAAPDETSMMEPVSIPQQQENDRYDDDSAGYERAYDYAGSSTADDYDDDDDDDDPADEPPAQYTSPGDAARIAAMTTDVYVVDGRPRYHLRGCVHLMSRETEPLPVGEAVELGFTPCSVCEPDSSLLAAARRV